MTWSHRRVFLVMAAVAGCLSIPQWFLGAFGWRPGLEIESYHMFLGLFLIANGIAIFVLTVYFIGAAPLAVAHLLRGKEINWFDTMKEVSERGFFLSIVWVLILVFLFVFAGFVLLIVPAIIFGVWCALIIPVLMLEEETGSKAIKRSRELVRPKFKDMFLLCAILFLVLLVSLSVVDVPAWMFIGEGFVDATRNLVLSVWGFLVSVFLGPLTLVSFTLFYLDRIGGVEGLPGSGRT